MNAPSPMVGLRFGRLYVVAGAEDAVYPSGRRMRQVFTKCDCGTEKVLLICHIRSGKTTSCGCFRKETVSKLRSTHGDTRPSKGWSREYVAWSHIIQRCTNPKDRDYPDYGGRGIGVCDRWLNSYENFLADMGRKPSPKHSIDRYPNMDGDYEPTNCRWATPSEQAYNRRPKRWRKRPAEEIKAA